MTEQIEWNIPVPYAAQLTSAVPPSGSATQAAPAMMMDRKPGVESVELWNCGLSSGALSETALSVEESEAGWIIQNGRRSIRIPNRLPAHGSVPLWIEALRLDDGPWTGCGTTHFLAAPTELETAIESQGDAGIQWSTVYRFQGGGEYRFRARWARGGDTLEVEESCRTPDGAALGCIDWHPAGTGADTRILGGGEGAGAMFPLNRAGDYPSCRGGGEVCCDFVGHVSYWNQCNLAWIGFFDESNGFFAGMFSGWGDLWEQRDAQWVEVLQSEPGIGFLRFPVTHGRRGWGLVIADAEAATGPDRRCLLNRRKTQVSDLAPVKLETWTLRTDPAPSGLFSESDLQACRERLAQHPRMMEVLKAATLSPAVRVLLRDDPEAVAEEWKTLKAWAESEIKGLCEGGYERIIIFDGRLSKQYAYAWTLLELQKNRDAAGSELLSRVLQILAYIMEDPAFCRQDDFYVTREEAPRQFMRMGLAPVPPNFLAEYLSTVGVTALTIPGHPRSEVWNAHAVDGLNRFIERYFDPDGAYRESLNYHTHTLCTLMMFFQPLKQQGGFDFFAVERFRNTFSYLMSLQMPPLFDQPSLHESGGHVYAQQAGHPAAPLPANGNTGSEGREMMLRPDATLGAWAFRESDPDLSGRLMTYWDRGGQLVVAPDATLLTLLTLDPALPRQSTSDDSFYSPALGLVSRFSIGEDEGWCLTRAGDVTHHMDFDQGHIHLAVGGEVVLGDYGYHAKDGEGNSFHAAATRRHSTVTCHPNPDFSHAYTGLEEAPKAEQVRITEEWDWLVHRIEVNNYRDLSRLPYYVPIPEPSPFTHIRQVLVLKDIGGLFILDEFESLDRDIIWRLYPRRPLIPEEDGIYRFQTERAPAFRLQILNEEPMAVIANRQEGALAEFALKGSASTGVAAFLAPESSGINRVQWDWESRTLRVTDASSCRTAVLLSSPETHGKTLAVSSD